MAPTVTTAVTTAPGSTKAASSSSASIAVTPTTSGALLPASGEPSIPERLAAIENLLRGSPVAPSGASSKPIF